jgi:hypothetical protein
MLAVKSRSPTADRPWMPDYHLLDSRSGEGLLPWSWAEERLSKATTYWIATVRPEGQPHMTPVWGVWLNEAFCFSSSSRSRKVRNLVVNPHCVICPEGTREPVILEGFARRVLKSSILHQIVEAYNAKYAWDFAPTRTGVRDRHGNGGPVFAVEPRVVFGFGEDLSSSATRWTFTK